jgi:hypothetical protein
MMQVPNRADELNPNKRSGENFSYSFNDAYKDVAIMFIFKQKYTFPSLPPHQPPLKTSKRVDSVAQGSPKEITRKQRINLCPYRE